MKPQFTVTLHRGLGQDRKSVHLVLEDLLQRNVLEAAYWKLTQEELELADMTAKFVTAGGSTCVVGEGNGQDLIFIIENFGQ